MRRPIKNRLQPLALMIVAGTAAPALAQCTPEWLSPPTGTFSSGTYDLGGINSSVYANAQWYHPLAGEYMLVIGGQFATVAGATVNNIAAWDGTSWYGLGTGIPGGVVFSTAAYGTNLIATGNFGSAGGTSVSNIAQYNGTSWLTMGSGLSGGSGFATAVYNNLLYVGGQFNSAGGVSGTSRIARWTGSAWLSVGGGMNGDVTSLASSGSNLIAGGAFTVAGGTAANHIAAWNNTTWSALGVGTSSTVDSLCYRSVDNSVYVGGVFTTAGNLATGGFARWDGSAWHTNGGTFNGNVLAMSDYFDTEKGASELVIGGSFAAINGSPNIAQFDGTTYTNLGGGGANAPVRSLAYWNQSLVVGGDFSTIDGLTSQSLALWSGAPGTGFSGESGWSQLKPGSTGVVNALMTTNNGGSFYAGGNFVIHLDTGGGFNDTAQNIVGSDGTNFSPVTDCFQCGHIEGTSGGVYALGTYTHGNITLQRTDTIIGGTFTQAGGLSANNIASFAGAFGYSAMSTGMNGQVSAIAQYPATRNSPVYATGQFSTAGGNPASGIASWNGSTWSPVGTGLAGNDGRALTIYNGELIVGGGFSTAGGVAAPLVARWNGTTWLALPGAVLNPSTGGVDALTVFNGQLIVGGSFQSSSGPALNRVAAWNGTTWTAMDAGLPPEMNLVSALAVHNGELYAGGNVIILDGPGNHGQVAKWNGSSWNAVHGMEYAGGVNALTSAAGALWAGGSFGVASGHTAPYLSKYQCACYANCDNSTTAPILNVADFTCFIQRFASGDPYANCDNSSTPPVLNVADFTCFIQKFANGCGS